MDRVALKSFVDRIENVEGEQRDLGSDKRDIYKEVKGAGYDTKIVRKVVALRRLNDADRDEQEALLEAYKVALGMAVDSVRDEGLSLREAASRHGVSKSSIHRALTVPELSHDHETGELPRDMVADDLGTAEPVVEMLADDLGDYALIAPKPKRQPKTEETWGETLKRHMQAKGVCSDGSRIENHSVVICGDDPGPIPHFLRRPKREASV
jgi:uncharacterized protein (UPF0335 family)